MKKTFLRKMLSIIAVLVLVAALALTITGCKKQKEEPADADKVSFQFIVVHLDGSEKTFDITTDKETVGEALVDEKLIEGEESQYGLYVKTVDGETLDYDKDGKYWAFYINDEYASTGVDATEIESDAVYAFKAE